MPAPRTISITAEGNDNTGISPLWAWQSNPLTIELAIASSLSLISGAVTFCAEIQQTVTPAGETPLASANAAAAEAGGTFEFDTTAMSFSIGSGVASAILYLFITAKDADGIELQTLYARRIEIKAAKYSGQDPDPPTPAVYLSANLVTAEAAARQAADTAEASARQAADTAEAAARQAADTALQTAINGKAPLASQAEIDFGDVPSWNMAFTISHAGATPGQKVLATHAGDAATGRAADENEMDLLVVSGYVPSPDYITFFIAPVPGPVSGKFKINYQLS